MSVLRGRSLQGVPDGTAAWHPKRYSHTRDSESNVEQIELQKDSNIIGDQPRAPGNVKADEDPAVAICFAGHLRTFEHTWHFAGTNFIRSVREAGFKPHLIFITNPDIRSDRHHTDLKPVKAPEMFIRNLTREFVDDSDVAMKEVQAPQVKNHCQDCGIKGHRAMLDHSMDYIQPFFEQWYRVRECYRTAEERERSLGFRYAGMVRLRSDFVFLDKADPAAIRTAFETRESAPAERNTSREVLISDNQGRPKSWQTTVRTRILTAPPAIYVVYQKLNDWGILCHREVCDSYFHMVRDFEQCQAYPPNNTTDPCCYGHNHYYNRVQALRDWSVVEAPLVFPGTLWREDEMDCKRLHHFPPLLERCYALAKARGLGTPWVCELEGRVQHGFQCGPPPPKKRNPSPSNG